MELEILNISALEKWNRALADVGGADVYFSPGYLLPYLTRGEGRPILVVGRDGSHIGVHVTFVRELSGLDPESKNLVDLCSPYGYSGPLVGTQNNDFIEAFWQAWCERASSMGAVSEFIRFHPLHENAADFSRVIPTDFAGETVYMDLTRKNPEDGLSLGCKKRVRAAKRKGVTFEMVPPDEFAARFNELYTRVMDDKQAADYYYFDNDFLKAFIENLGPTCLMARVSYENRTAALALLFKWGPFLHYHLGAQDYELRHLGPSNVLLYESALYGQKRRMTHFHLGGGYKDQLGLLDFKKGFSDRTAKFYVGRVIHLPEEYQRLVESRNNGLQKPGDGDFFPAYRSPR